MFEDQTFETIMERMLEEVPDDVDKRENSVMWNALAPAAAELAQAYIWLSRIPELAFADTAEGEYLERRTAEFGTNRKPATAAERLGQFYTEDDVPFDIPIGSRFFIADLHYVARDRLAPGQYRLVCETEGVVGNDPEGALLPIENIPGLVKAELAGVIAAGENEETDESLRQRHYDMVNEPAFGGNIADYRHKINGIPGVGGTKVFPTWNGGGTVRCTFIGSDYLRPSLELVKQIQSTIDPEFNQGQGLGWAPIGHEVTVVGVSTTNIGVETTVVLEQDVTLNMVERNIEEIIEEYLHLLRSAWESQDQIVVRISQLEARMLNVPGVLDVRDTKLNDETTNIEIEPEKIPVLSGVSIIESDA